MIRTTLPQLAVHKGLRGAILLELKCSQPLTANELAAKLDVSPNAIRHHLKELEIESLIARNVDATPQEDEAAYQLATEVLFAVRKRRSEDKQPLKIPITKVTVQGEPAQLGLMPIVEADLRSALRVHAFELGNGPFGVSVQGYDGNPEPAPS